MPPTIQVKRFAEVQGEWEEILPLCSTNTVFVTPWWQRTWWHHFGNESELQILSLSDNDVTLGIAPLMLKDGVVGFLGGTDLFDYHDFLVPKGNEVAFYSALIDYLQHMDWHTIDLVSLPECSPTLQYIPALAKQKGYDVVTVKEDMTPAVLLPSTWEEYMARLPKKERHELRRKMRRLEGAGHSRQYVCESPETLPQCLQDFFRLHRTSRPEKAEFMTPQRERFLVDAAVELSSRHQFKLAFLELDGVRVASCMAFDYLDSYLLYNSGYNPSYANLSVGLLNKALVIKEAIEAGKRCFDFLRGTERYKYGLGAVDHAIYQLTVRR